MRLKLNFEHIIIGLLLLPVILTAIPYGTVENWWEAAFIIYILVLFCLWATHDAFQGSWVWKGKNITMPLAALAFFALLQSVLLWSAQDGTVRAISADPQASRYFAFKMFAFALYLELLLRFTGSRKKLKILVFTVIGTALGSAIFGILRESLLAGSAQFILPAVKHGTGFAQFVNRNHFAFLIGIAAGLVLGLVTGSGWRQLKIFYAGLLLILVTALTFTASRGGFFTFIVQFFFFCFYIHLRRLKEERAQKPIPNFWWIKKEFGNLSGRRRSARLYF